MDKSAQSGLVATHPPEVLEAETQTLSIHVKPEENRRSSQKHAGVLHDGSKTSRHKRKYFTIKARCAHGKDG